MELIAGCGMGRPVYREVNIAGPVEMNLSINPVFMDIYSVFVVACNLPGLTFGKAHLPLILALNITTRGQALYTLE